MNQKRWYLLCLCLIAGLYDIHIQLAGVPILGWEAPPLTATIYASEVFLPASVAIFLSLPCWPSGPELFYRIQDRNLDPGPGPDRCSLLGTGTVEQYIIFDPTWGLYFWQRLHVYIILARIYIRYLIEWTSNYILKSQGMWFWRS